MLTNAELQNYDIEVYPKMKHNEAKHKPAGHTG